MATVYIRDVPDPVAETLKERAAAAGQSLSAYVGAELERIASVPTNAEIAARLAVLDRSGGPSANDIVDAVRDARR